MSIRFELTAIAPELMDAVVYMDNSPAYAAFKEEIEAILHDFNEKGTLSSSWKIDEADLTEKSEETLKNMHRAFLIWSYAEEIKNGANVDCSCNTYVKLFFKGQCDTLMALNGGAEFVSADSVKALIESYKAKISSDSEVYESVKSFFKGYVYGYYFNFLSEAEIMKKYAEMLAYLGVMSNKIQTGISEQQKILPKIALLLSNDRFKYISGFIPEEHMMRRVLDRIDFASMPENEAQIMKTKIKAYIDEKYKHDKEDDIPLISDNVSTDILSDLLSSYINVPAFSSELYSKCYNGVRTFLDADKDDTGDYDAKKLAQLVSEKCSADADDFYSCGREALLDTSLEGDIRCYKYPLVAKDEKDFWFASIYEELIYPVLDKKIYAETPDAVPADFTFAAEAVKTNCIRAVAGITDKTICVRRDKLANVEKIKTLASDSSLSERDRKMLMLEQVLYIVSGSCSEARYKAIITENLFGTKLYDDYIRYRMDILFNKGIKSLSDKKWLLDRINEIH